MRRIDGDLIKDAEDHLAKRDRRIRHVMRKHGRCTLAQRQQDPFRALISAVVGQQLSAKAAMNLRTRTFGVLGDDVHQWPSILAKNTPHQLRTLGLSMAKARCLIGIGTSVNNGDLEFKKLDGLDDEEVVRRLTEYKGVGRWTAEMVLIFGFLRPDVLSLGDIGLRRAVQAVYGLAEKPTDDEFSRLAWRWKPYRTIASWYLWRALD